MNQYLLSTYAVNDEVPGAPSTPEEGQAFMARVMALETEMEANGAFVFGGALGGANQATIVNADNDAVTHADGPTVDSNVQMAGFYIINADDYDAALSWAGKVAQATHHPIEVREFRATGQIKDFAQS